MPCSENWPDGAALACGAYRVVYWIDEDGRVVTVDRVDHRADVYRPR